MMGEEKWGLISFFLKGGGEILNKRNDNKYVIFIKKIFIFKI